MMYNMITITFQYGNIFSLQVEDSAFESNESILERLLTVDDVDAIHTNCAGLHV